MYIGSPHNNNGSVDTNSLHVYKSEKQGEMLHMKRYIGSPHDSDGSVHLAS